MPCLMRKSGSARSACSSFMAATNYGWPWSISASNIKGMVVQQFDTILEAGGGSFLHKLSIFLFPSP